MRFFKKTSIDFMGRRYMWYAISATVILVGMLSLAVKGFHFGIDFLGGTELIIEFNGPADIGKVRSMMDNAGFPKSEIKGFGSPNKILLRTLLQGEGTTVGDRIKTALQQTFPDMNPHVLSEQKIGPKVGKELRTNALYAVLSSLIAMSLYVAFRFKFIFGVGALVALFHDVLVVLGCISIFDGLTSFTNFEIDQNMIAAFLTVVGLSMNDTVVIFDRIRENQKIYRTMSLIDLINKSLNETLSRTIITSGTVLIITLILFFFGGEVNRGFAFALSIGITTGTYSSIYIASAIVLDYTRRLQAKRGTVGGTAVADKVKYEPVSQRS
ncbi:MAG TPA: protein translocase subunit SecF [Bacteroidota bacterium]|nr:protein translocase subunit SecF [Bacteroidota bacterium]